MNAQDLINAANEAGYEARSYSGRGMYGERCVGIKVPREASLSALVLELAMAVVNAKAWEYSAFEAIDELRSLTSHEDSMGLRKIVYFPALPWPETKNPSEEG